MVACTRSPTNQPTKHLPNTATPYVEEKGDVDGFGLAPLAPR